MSESSLFPRNLFALSCLCLFLFLICATPVIAGITPDSRSTCQVSIPRMPVWEITAEQADTLIAGSNNNLTGLQILEICTLQEFSGSHLPGAIWVDSGLSGYEEVIRDLDPERFLVISSRSGYPEQVIRSCEDAGVKGVFSITPASTSQKSG
jgi:hypothetical protein